VTGFSDYDRYDALGLAELVRRREVRPLELVEEAITRIERHGRLNAVVQRLFDRARRVAAAPPEGPLSGVPYLVKDMVAHAGTPLTFANTLMQRLGHIPSESHEVIRRSEQAGLVVVGKTNASELGLLPTTEPALYGPTQNPWRLDRSPGGSSGGSAAAVAASLVPMAHGNDGGGSIRIPASACGVFGLKPSRGRNPGSAGEIPDGITAEHCLSRTVRDSAALLDVTRGPLPGDRWWAPPPARPFLAEVEAAPGSLRIAFATRDFRGRPAHPDCAAAVEQAALLCEELGHRVEPAAPAIDGERFNEAFLTLWVMLPAFLFKVIAAELRRRPGVGLIADLLGDERLVSMVGRLKVRRPFEPLTQKMVALGRGLTAADLWLAWWEMERAGRAMARFLTEHDLFLSPVLGSPPVPTGEITGQGDPQRLREKVIDYVGYTPICNTAGLPAMSVPLYWNAEGLPVGVHFVAPFGDEATLFRLAGQLERARPWRDRRPPLTS